MGSVLRLFVASTLLWFAPSLTLAQGFRIPEVDISDLDPTNLDGGIRKELRNLDKARLDAMSRSPRAGRDYTKIYLKNETNEPISVAIRVILFEVRDGNLTYIDDPSASPWTTKKWYKLNPGERAHVADTNNTIVYTYAKSDSGKEWAGSHRVNVGTSSKPNYLEFTQRYVGIDVPEEWTFSFSSRKEIVKIEYTIWNDTGRTVRFSMQPSGKSYVLEAGKTFSGTSNEIDGKSPRITLSDSGRTIALTSGKHKFWWKRDAFRVALDLNYKR